MKICVYAICKNESQFVDRWMDSMSEADGIYVLDTGSTDDTVEKLRARGAQVMEELVSPWRFDVARNRSLALVPEDADLCVCTDLDEVLHPGWRAALERAWTPEAGQARYRYTWSFRPDGSEGVVFWYEKVHRRQGYRWVHPVHEILEWMGPGQPGPMVTVPGMQLDHYPDPAKSRGQYLPLLELSVAEAPEDDRNLHYLGREYLFHQRWDECIATLKKHLALPTAVWADERAASMRFIGRAYLQKEEPEQARGWFFRAIAQAPHLREPWMEMAMLCYHQEDWDGVLYFTGRALAIAVRPDTYICEAEPWGPLPHDLRCQAFFRTGRNALALEEARKALALSPADPRLRGNVAVLEHL
ncbi:tetratricopeptide repeat-containing glycosyltransferase [Pseudoflavonifractor phocaeensis]|uniref:tetratricopeptide repeat-containing glycosyltransferase n=1 Tax=Pseudoflavonifractor phocaeensis TaxID=1870988 RepID=UPI001958F553|nr:glycosyl transferase family 2 [Pseudoflavonifractor phocaeensis]MBM6926298.1 glycosyl transferase family 2 [Pseudoflavonifractor phocaeensis]